MLIGVGLNGCNKWDDHNSITDPLVGKDLFQQISETPELSRFAELLTLSGYDKVIASSKTFTVFAPTNAALASLDAATVNDSARLRKFVANHITYQAYQTSSATTPLRLQMLSGKYNNLSGNLLDEASITGADKYAKNGYLQIIDKMLTVLPNAWEFLETSPLSPAKQTAYLQSLFQNVFDPTNAIQVGVNPATGEPVYQAGTDSVRTNLFWRDVYDLRNESKEFTFFLLEDAAWDAEVAKFSPYYLTGSMDSTTSLANWSVAKDLAIEGAYTQSTLPDTILSKFNVKMGIDKSTIVQSIKVSNGIVHILRSLDVRPKDKFTQYIIEAESESRAPSVDRRNNTYLRDKIDPATGRRFTDLLVFNHGVPLYNIRYRLTGVPALKFRAYWVAVHDRINNSTAPFNQKLGIGTATSTALPYITVQLNDYNEVYLGEFTMTSYSPTLNVYLTAANTTTANANPIVCDYIRLEPVF